MDPLCRPQPGHPVCVTRPHQTINQRLDHAGKDMANGTVHTVHGAAKTVVNAPLIAADGLAAVAVLSGGGVILAAEGLAAGVAATSGVVVGLGVDAIELSGKAAQALGNASESLGNAAVQMQQSSNDLLLTTSARISRLCRKGWAAIKMSFDSGVQAVSPSQ